MQDYAAAADWTDSSSAASSELDVPDDVVKLESDDDDNMPQRKSQRTHDYEARVLVLQMCHGLCV